ncbi:YitT family protein [Salinibacterium sp. SYSU T00001]|uniref:YitT family protein n=1 Tax=Homoserinimonas sedimenticola TaxID=2986805 RepID=UPI002235840D|nr:YitT family protein [Salinibacterium sedimenticola]MCW4384452.1 YitT family protein [Salinibacterium sedimenticola]
MPQDSSPGVAEGTGLSIAPHRPTEDAIALVVGSLLLSFGVVFLEAVGAVSGGLAGVAFLVSYSSGWPFGVAFFIVNIPFYALSLLRMGWQFTLKTVVVVVLVSAFAEVHPLFFEIERIAPLYACLLAGVLLGMGMLVLFRHRASAGGLGILALFLQDRLKWSAGLVQLAFDSIIVLAALLVTDVATVLASVAGVVVLNVILAMNHRPGRYFG